MKLEFYAFRTLRLWNYSDGSNLQVYYGHTSFVYAVSCISESEFVSSAEDRTVRIWKGISTFDSRDNI